MLFFIGLGLAVVVFGGALWLAPGESTSTDASALLDSAREQLGEGRVGQALQSARAAVDADPHEVSARALYGHLLLQAGQFGAARDQLERARNNLSQPDHDSPDDEVEAFAAVERDYLSALLGLRALAAAQELVQDTPDLIRDARWRLLEAHLQVLQGRRDVARATFKQLLQRDQTNDEALRGLVQVLIEQGELDQAAHELHNAEALAQRPTYKLLSAELALRRDDYPLAIRAYTQILAGGEAYHARAHAGLARAYIEGGRAGDANPHIEAFLRARPTDPEGPLLQSMQARRAGDLEAAQRLAVDALGLEPTYRPALLLGAELMLLRGDLTGSEELLARLMKQAPDSYEARLLLASVLLGLGRQREILTALAPLDRREGSDARVQAMLAVTYSSMGDRRRAQEHWERASALAGGVGPGVRVRAAMDAQRAPVYPPGALEALDALEARIIERKMLETRTELVVLSHLRAGDSSAALDEVESSVSARAGESGADLAEVFNLKGLALEVQGSGDKARLAYLAAIDADSGFAPALRNLARLQGAQGDLEAARQSLQRALESGPRDAATLVALARLLRELDERPRAVSLLQAARDANPRALAPRLLLAEHYLDIGDSNRAMALASQAQELAPRDSNALALAARVHMALDNPDAAVELLTRATLSEPNSARLLAKLGEAELAAGNRGAARERFEASLLHDPSIHRARAMLGHLAIENGDYETALRHGEYLRSQLPQGTDGQLLMALAARGRGQLDVALPLLLDAHERQPSSQVVLALADLFLESGQIARAEDVLDRWLAAHTLDVKALLLRARVHLAHSDSMQAMKTYQRVIEINAENIDAIESLARLYADSDLPRALELAERAVAIRPDSASVAHTLGALSVRAGNTERGLTMLRRASALDSRPSYVFDLAAALASGPGRQEAKELLRALLLSDVKFEARAEAEKLYLSIK